ncbi:MAG: pyridoxal phosphate-dependent aminotransferase, partial [Clostridiales bacterium]|nr:pyridoxal phosphate-dependent aminotransferase [Clostridiales bacterium]
PKEVVDALTRAAAHGIYGYSEPYPDYFEVMSEWTKTYFSFLPKPEWHIQTPGVVPALAVALKAFTKENDAVIIQQPVYYPFSEGILQNNRRLVNSPLKNQDGYYTIDFEDFEKKIVENDVKLFLLCSPHNPVGRVWTAAELTRLGEICLRHGVIVASDEIHANIVYPEHRHSVFLTLDKRFEKNTAVFTSPGKTFNLAGLQISDIFIPNPELFKLFKDEYDRSGYSQLNTFAHIGSYAAYKSGAVWLKELLAYLDGNRRFIADFLQKNLPQIGYKIPEGTYLAWLDLKKLGLSVTAQYDLVVNRARLWLDSGKIFGIDGIGFERVNFACPQAVLKQALEQLVEAITT